MPPFGIGLDYASDSLGATVVVPVAKYIRLAEAGGWLPLNPYYAWIEHPIPLFLDLSMAWEFDISYLSIEITEGALIIWSAIERAWQYFLSSPKGSKNQNKTWPATKILE